MSDKQSSILEKESRFSDSDIYHRIVIPKLEDVCKSVNEINSLKSYSRNDLDDLLPMDNQVGIQTCS